MALAIWPSMGVFSTRPTWPSEGSWPSCAWTRLCRRLGWFLIPLGQNSLYVYITHLFVLVLLYNVAPYLLYMVPVSWGPLDTVSLASHLTSLAMAWLMVKTRFLFWLIPR